MLIIETVEYDGATVHKVGADGEALQGWVKSYGDPQPPARFVYYTALAISAPILTYGSAAGYKFREKVKRQLNCRRNLSDKTAKRRAERLWAELAQILAEGVNG